MGARDTLEITFYMVSIILAILIIIMIIWSVNYNNSIENNPPKNTNTNNFNRPNNVANIDAILDNLKPIQTANPVEIPKYDKFKQNAKFKINNQAYENKDQVNYKIFIEIAQTDKFQTQFLKSLCECYQEKEIFYNNAKIQTIRELLVCRGPDATGQKSHDSTADRLERYLNEIELILKEIKSKQEKLTKDLVRENIIDIINNQEKGFASLTGREDVKDYISKQLFSFANEPSIMNSSFSNILLYGSSGVGKTKMGETIAYIYSKCGIFVRNKFKYITSRNLTSQYINEAAQLTMNELCSTLEGILFIDEAYSLGPPKDMIHKSHTGVEAIDEMVNFLDKFMGRSVIIMAGYEKDMENRLMSQNEGLSRRFSNKFILSDYSSDQLTEILIRRLKICAPKITLSQLEVNFLYSQIQDLSKSEKKPFPKQAGDMLELAGCISKSIVSSIRYRWSEGDKNNIILLILGMNEYLRPKSMSISLEK